MLVIIMLMERRQNTLIIDGFNILFDCVSVILCRLSLDHISIDMKKVQQYPQNFSDASSTEKL